MKVDLEVVGADKAEGLLTKIADQAADLKPALNAAARIMRDGLRQQVASKGQYLGAPWAPLAASTLERKKRQGLPAKQLYAKGIMLTSLTGGNSAHVFKITKTMARVGTKDYLVKFHHAGTSKGVPSRKLLGIHKEDRAKIFGVVREHLLT